MDQTTLVSGGQALVRALDADGLRTRLAMWVHDEAGDAWKLWLVPPRGSHDRHDFYRRVSKVISAHWADVAGIDVGETLMVNDDHPAIRGLGKSIKAPDISSIRFEGNVYNGFYLPSGIILRSDL